jgi:hypothetical protein
LPGPIERFQGPIDELGSAQTKGPVDVSVSHYRNNHILRPDATLGLQPLRELRIGRLLLLGGPALLEDLKDYDAVRALKSQASVLGNDVALRMFGDDLITRKVRRRPRA